MNIDKIKSQLAEMLKLQWEMNCKVHPEWSKQGYDWNNAIIAELGEYLESVNYKWWSKKPADLDNARVELVDIWHFLMSKMMNELGKCNIEYLEYFLIEANYCWNNSSKSSDIKKVSKFMYSVLDGDAVHAPGNWLTEFFRLVKANGMTWDDLVDMYFTKNALNVVRQEHGYKQGTYQKQWKANSELLNSDTLIDGELYEDNVIAMAIVKTLKNKDYANILHTLDAYYTSWGMFLSLEASIQPLDGAD